MIRAEVGEMNSSSLFAAWAWTGRLFWPGFSRRERDFGADSRGLGFVFMEVYAECDAGSKCIRPRPSRDSLNRLFVAHASAIEQRCRCGLAQSTRESGDPTANWTVHSSSTPAALQRFQMRTRRICNGAAKPQFYGVGTNSCAH